VRPVRAGAGAVAAAAGAAAAASLPAAPGVYVPRRPPDGTVAPGPATIALSLPLAGEGTSTETLSVSSSQSISSCATLSPTALYQVATVASVTLSPSAGTLISTSRSFAGADSLFSDASLPGSGAASLAGFAAAFSSTVASSASTPTVSP